MKLDEKYFDGQMVTIEKLMDWDGSYEKSDMLDFLKQIARDAVQECREAVELCVIQTDLRNHFEMSRKDEEKQFPLILRDDAIAAISKVGKREE